MLSSTQTIIVVPELLAHNPLWFLESSCMKSLSCYCLKVYLHSAHLCPRPQSTYHWPKKVPQDLKLLHATTVGTVSRWWEGGHRKKKQCVGSPLSPGTTACSAIVHALDVATLEGTTPPSASKPLLSPTTHIHSNMQHWAWEGAHQAVNSISSGLGYKQWSQWQHPGQGKRLVGSNSSFTPPSRHCREMVHGKRCLLEGLLSQNTCCNPNSNQ